MRSRSCPELATLEALLRDRLPAVEQEFLAGHLEHCASCRVRLEALAMPTKSILPGGQPGVFGRSETDVPPRALIEQWRDQGQPTVVSEAPHDATEMVLDLLEPSDHPDELGRLGSYHVLRVIGQGGMGIVLLACDSVLRRQVALKLMQPALAVYPEARERFLREARAAAAVHDDHVVTIHAVESGRVVPYLVMEYVPGRSLQEHLDTEERLPMAEVAALGAQIAEGLAAAHASGLIHRDVKPANILISARTGRAKLTDFGLARAGSDPVLTRPGIVAGTPEYMAPEQAAGQVVDHRADLYSLGAVLYAVLTGRPPHPASSTRDLLQQLSVEARPTARRSDPDTPAVLAQLVVSLLQNEPAKRPESAAAVAKALRGLADSSAGLGRGLTRSRAAVAIGLACLLPLSAWLGRGSGESAIRPEPRSAPAAIPPGSNGPFSLVGGRRFSTLAAAIANAPTSHATIEINGDGPYLSGPIRIKSKPLTLRAGRGCRPVLRFVPDDGAVPTPWLETDSPLTLEGLEVHAPVPGEIRCDNDLSRLSAIAVRDGPFRAERCRFVVGPRNACVSLRECSGQVRACQFSAPDGIALHWASRPGRTLDIQQNILAAHRALVVNIGGLNTGLGHATLRIKRTTIRAYAAVKIVRENEGRRQSIADATHPDLRVESEGSVFDASHILGLVDCTRSRRSRGNPPVALIAPRIKSRIAWREQDNLYPLAPSWLSFGLWNRKITRFEDGPADLAAWGRFWYDTDADTGSIETRLAFRGPRTGANPADHLLVLSGDGDPQPFASRGADVDRCGPGADSAANFCLTGQSKL